MLFFLLLLTFSSTSNWQPDTYAVVQEESIVAIVTHKAGIASAFAHNHLIVASAYDLELSMEEGNPQSILVSVSIPVDSLTVDDPAIRDRWAERIAELGLEDDLGTPSEKDRSKIRGEMMSRKQLAATDYDHIVAESTRSESGDIEFDCDAAAMNVTLDLTIKGSTHPVTFSTCSSLSADSLFIEAVGHATFRNFGIKPFSGVLGTVKNRNEFDIYVNLVAIKQAGL